MKKKSTSKAERIAREESRRELAKAAVEYAKDRALNFRFYSVATAWAVESRVLEWEDVEEIAVGLIRLWRNKQTPEYLRLRRRIEMQQDRWYNRFIHGFENVLSPEELYNDVLPQLEQQRAELMDLAEQKLRIYKDLLRITMVKAEVAEKTVLCEKMSESYWQSVREANDVVREQLEMSIWLEAYGEVWERATEQ